MDLRLTSVLTSHMPHLLVRPQSRVSVIITCKTVKSDTVENTVRGVTREVSDEELATVLPRGYLTPSTSRTLTDIDLVHTVDTSSF